MLESHIKTVIFRRSAASRIRTFRYCRSIESHGVTTPSLGTSTICHCLRIFGELYIARLMCSDSHMNCDGDCKLYASHEFTCSVDRDTGIHLELK